MGGVVIAFPGDWPRAHRAAKTKKVSPRSRKRPPHIKAQVERITAILAELQGMSLESAEVSAMLAQTSATMCKVEERLVSRRLSHSAPPPVTEDQGDSQPHVDPEVLERHFYSLDG